MLCLRTGRPARRQSADRFDCILYRAAGAAGGPYTRFYRYRAHMAWTGRYLKHRTRSKGPCGAQTAVRSTVRQYTWPMCNSKTVTNRPRRGGGLTGGSIGTAPIWRRPDEILSFSHVLRDHVVLIQPSDRQYDNIHGLCVTVKQLQTVRGGVGDLHRRFYRYRAHMAWRPIQRQIMLACCVRYPPPKRIKHALIRTTDHACVMNVRVSCCRREERLEKTRGVVAGLVELIPQESL